MRLLAKRRVILASAVALAALTAVLIGALGVGASSGAPGEPATAPTWLQEKATQLVTVVCKDPSPTSVAWRLATAGQYAQAAAITDAAAAAVADSARPLYVVVAHGDFTYAAAHMESAEAPLPRGQTLVVAFDPDTHIMTDLSLLGPDADAESVLGTMNPLVP